MGVAERWSGPGAGRRYAEERWADPRRAARDPAAVARLLARHAAGAGTVLDAPCGAGRLRAAVEAGGARRWTGLDASAAMLAEAARGGGGALVRGDVARLPFPDGAFDAVVCCRLLHHLAEEEELARVLAELVRVARVAVVASFWDAATPGGARHRRPGRGTRVARTRGALRRALAAAGAEVVAFAPRAPLVVRQAFVVARPRG